VVRSQVEPAGQQAPQTGPAQATLPAGQLARFPAVSQVRGSVAAVQRQTLGRSAVVGQQVAPLLSHAPRTHWHTPPVQSALSWQRLSQSPQWRGSLRVSTQAPPQHWLEPLPPQDVPSGRSAQERQRPP
jgi:hypothetical protein